MIKRSFKPATCKTALKMASSRIKLLKNKKEAQVRQLKRELAQLLAAGQDPTARIRVEHVVREEKMMAAYELIEIYSELILARMSMIESQKNCPIDLKEAVASVIFASPRCADVPELMDVRKHFTAKYGKDFVTGAVELRPDCGVSRLMVEKLAAKAPDGPTKIKILTAIAEEHNVKWEPKSFGESDAKHAEDLLNGATTFQQATTIHVQTHHAEEPPNSVAKGPINDRVSSKNYEKNDPGTNSYIPNSRPSSYSQTPTEFQHTHTGDGSDFSSGRQSWNMEFKDATAAARAAAESAERASMAARAAAELSSQGRISRQHTTESPKASASASRDEGPQYHTGSRLHGEHFTQHPTSNTSSKRNSETRHVQLGGDQQDDLAGLAERFYNLRNSNNNSDQSTSPNPSSASVVDHLEVNDLRKADRHSQKGSPELDKRNSLRKAGLKKKPIGSDVDIASEVDDGMKFETDDYLERESVRKQSSNVSSWSHSQTSSGDNNVFSYQTVQEVNDLPMADRHFQKGSPELEKRNSLREASLKKKSIGSEINIASEVEDRMRFETDDYLERESVRKQSSNVSSQSHSQPSSGDYNAFSNRKVQEVNDLWMADRHSQKGSLELEKRTSLREASLKNKSIRSEIDIASEVEDSMKFETGDYLERASVRKQSSNVSSRSHSQTSSGDNNVFSYQTVQEVNDLPMVDRHFQKGSPELEKRDSLREASLKKKSIGSEIDIASEVEDRMRFETDDYLERASVRKQSSNVSSQSHSQTSSGDYNAFSNRKVEEVNDLWMADRHSQKGSLELEKRTSLREASLKNKSIRSEIDIASEVEDSMKFETGDYLERVSVRKQSSNVSSRSHSRTSSGDYNVFSSKKIEEPDEDAFVIDGRIARDDLETTSCDNADVVFDGSGSDDDGVDFDLVNEDDKEASSSYFLSGGRKSSSYMVADTHTRSPRTKTDVSFGESSSQLHFTPEKHPTSVFSEGLTSGMVPSQQDDLSPMTFDDSEGPSSDSEEEQDKSPVIQRTSTDVFPHKVNAYPRNPEPIRSENPHPVRSRLVEEESLGSNSKTWLKPSSPDSDAAVVHSQRKQESGATPKTGRRFGHSDLYTSQSSLRTVTSESNSNDYKDNLQRTEVSAVEDDVQRHQLRVYGKDAEESSLDTGKVLNFGTLTGGLKNKGYRFPPYSQSTSGKLSMSKQDEESTSSRIDKSSSSHMLGINSVADDRETSNEIVPPKSNKKTSSRTPIAYFDPDDADEEHPQQNFSSSQESYTQKPIELNKRSSLEAYFGSNGDSEDKFSKRTSTVQTSLGAGISQRTKASPASRKDSYSKATVASESSTSADYVAETQRNPRSLTNSSDYEGSSDQRKSAEQPSSKVMPNSKKNSNEQSSSRNSNSIDSRQNLSHLKSSDSWANSEQARLEQAAPKPSPEPKRSLRESPKSSPREQPSASRPPVTAALGTAESSKVSSARGEAPSRENSEQARLEQAASKPSPEPKRSLRESPKSSIIREQPPASRPPVTAALGTAKSSKVSSARGEAPSRENSEQARLELAAPKPSPEPKRSLREIPRSSPREQPPASRPPVTAASGTAESSKVSSASGEAPSRENSINRASHVHPKLPDYDSLAARMRSLRDDRK